MSDTRITVRLQGSAVAHGIELRRLIQFGEKFQKAIDRVAYSIEKQTGSKRKFSEIRNDTHLRLTATERGSFVAHLEFSKPPILFADYTDIASEAALKLVAGINSLMSSTHHVLPEGYDHGVLVVLKELGQFLLHGIDRIEMKVQSQSFEYQTTYDEAFKTRISEWIIEPEEKIAGVEGQLLMVNFGKEKRHCHLYLNDEEYIRCSFDEDTSEEIEDGLRQSVYVIGIATIDPVSDEISHLHIKKLHPINPLDGTNSLSLSDALNSYKEENDTFASFQRGWEQALSGQTHSIEDLWEGINAG